MEIAINRPVQEVIDLAFLGSNSCCSFFIRAFIISEWVIIAIGLLVPSFALFLLKETLINFLSADDPFGKSFDVKCLKDSRALDFLVESLQNLFVSQWRWFRCLIFASLSSIL